MVRYPLVQWFFVHVLINIPRAMKQQLLLFMTVLLCLPASTQSELGVGALIGRCMGIIGNHRVKSAPRSILGDRARIANVHST